MNCIILESEKFLIIYEKSQDKIVVQEKSSKEHNYYELDSDLNKLKDLSKLIFKFVELNTI